MQPRRSSRRCAAALATGLVLAPLGAGCRSERMDAPADSAADVEVPVVTMRRLSRVEYDHTVRDLLGTTLRPGTRFPADPPAHGFDNQATALSLSAAQLELYELATEDLVDDVRARGFVPMLTCDPTPDPRACLKRSVAGFIQRAWRRPASAAELMRLMALFDEAVASGDAPEEGLAQVLRATLLSPFFLYRVERDPPHGAAHPLSAYELAARLSYFLWSSMPDDELRAAAADGSLLDPTVRRAQVRRMLDDAKAASLVHDFAGQWLQIRLLDDIFRDDTRLTFDEELRAAMRDELYALLGAFLEEDRDLRELLTTTTTFGSRRLAGQYGLATVPFDGLAELDLAALPRRGLLTTPGWLALTSPPFRTSPAQRGAFVLSQLLCTPLGPPPPDATVRDGDAVEGTTREKLEAHVADPACAGCHRTLDPIGFAFEHYDAVGRWRDEDGNGAIETAGVLPDGTAFDDALGLADTLAKDPAFVRCAARQAFTYALGRAPMPEDEPHLDAIVAHVAEAGYGLRELFVAVAMSDSMAWRRRDRGQQEAPR